MCTLTDRSAHFGTLPAHAPPSSLDASVDCEIAQALERGNPQTGIPVAPDFLHIGMKLALPCQRVGVEWCAARLDWLPCQIKSGFRELGNCTVMTRKHQPKMVPETWIVAADRSRARIFQLDLDNGSTLVEIDSFENPEGSAQAHEVESSRQGWLRAGVPETAQPATDFAHKVAERFARQVVDYLEHARETNRFGHLVLVASPLFLGILRKQLSAPLKRTLKGTVDKDYLHMAGDDFAARIGQWIAQNA